MSSASVLTNPPVSPLLQAVRIGKRFSGVSALAGVDLSIHAGEIHAIVGENGAGKSTLIKILAGVYSHPDYEGDLLIDGAPQRFAGVRDGTRAGVSVVHQELALVPQLSVAQNIALGREPQRWGILRTQEIHRRAIEVLRPLHLDADASTPVEQLGIGKQQIVEIAKALSQHARILILDEPTAALTSAEAEVLLRILLELRNSGIAILYVSHRLAEVFRIADRITVLRDGKLVATGPKEAFNEARVISLMVGREVSDLFPTTSRTPGKTVLSAANITATDPRSGATVVKDVGLSVRSGEVLGIAGLMGAGRTELLMSLFGAWRGTVSGSIELDGRPVHIRKPGDAIALGIALVTEDRKRFGLLLHENIVRNLTLASMRKVSGKVFTDDSRERSTAQRLSERLGVKAPSLLSPIGKLSGGNQQKVVIGKWLLTEPRVLLLDEPTRGIDVGARQEIYHQIDEFARKGMAIVMVSSDLPEVLGMSDRILVLHEGRVTGMFSRDQATAEAVMACATGQGRHL